MQRIWDEMGKPDIERDKMLFELQQECLEVYRRKVNQASRSQAQLQQAVADSEAELAKISAALGEQSSYARQKERGHEFLYDGVSLLSMLEQYCDLKRERELEHQRQRDQRKLQGQLMVEQEALFGLIPSPSNSAKKNFRPSMGGLANKRLSLGGSMLQTPYAGKAAPSSRLSSSSKQQTLQSGRRESFVVPRKQQPCKVSNAPRTESAQRKKPLLNPPRTESTQTRKALSPLSALFSSNASTVNIQESEPKERLKETVSSNKTPIMTPTKMMASAVEGNITPKTLPIPMPVTPSTVSTVMTPASRHVSACADDIEYSFEERRAGYTYNPLSHTKVISKCLI
ncbi:hypothetical protein K7X08_008026 [Anisodus acutangulus]|uniref:Uncharacterized protein n=1 Tax=Anisodus acutangulus TaxID=402998 RepID=A0A9Q1MT60_9SOLA|nr:hypothetical protein K7X08_008026 [Anisodus acutangulus]